MSYVETYEDDGPREPFELEVPGRSMGPLIGLRKRVPWPLAGLPFPFDDIMMMYGAYLGVAPTPDYAPPAPAVALQPCGKRVDPNDVCTGKDAIPPLDALLSWLTMPVRVPDVDRGPVRRPYVRLADAAAVRTRVARARFRDVPVAQPPWGRLRAERASPSAPRGYPRRSPRRAVATVAARGARRGRAVARRAVRGGTPAGGWHRAEGRQTSPFARRCDSGAGSSSGGAARWMERIARASQGGVRATGVLVGMGAAGRVCE